MTRPTPPFTARVHEYLTRLAQTYVVTPALRDEALRELVNSIDAPGPLASGPNRQQHERQVAALDAVRAALAEHDAVSPPSGSGATVAHESTAT